MWSLRNLLFILCIVLRCVTSAVALINVTGYVGRDVKVSCPYDQGYESYEKYLCKNDCDYDDVLITTSDQRKNKYSIRDDETAQIFTVTIYNLQSMDAGQYWCGVTITGRDTYTEVNLKLVQDNCCNIVTKIQSYEGHSESITCPYESQYQNNLKYICKGNRPSTCLQQAFITSVNTQNGRFRLNDDKVSRRFTVIISRVSQMDSGSYLCGVQRNSDLDVFSAVQLEVKEWCCVKTNRISGTVGRPLTLQCPYPPQHRHNRKFLCKGQHHNSCTDVMSQSRFTLQDGSFSSYFLVQITKLEAADAGTYWCGSDSLWRAGDYTKIQLSVAFLQRTTTTTTTTITTTTTTTITTTTTPTTTTVETLGTNSTHIPSKPFKDATHYVVFIVPPVLLLICALVVIVYKCKLYKVKEDKVAMNVNAPKAEGTGEVMVEPESDMYGNQEVVVYSKKETSKEQNVCNYYDDADGDEADYENVTSEVIYCNKKFP